MVLLACQDAPSEVVVWVVLAFVMRDSLAHLVQMLSVRQVALVMANATKAVANARQAGWGSNVNSMPSLHIKHSLPKASKTLAQASIPCLSKGVLLPREQTK